MRPKIHTDDISYSETNGTLVRDDGTCVNLYHDQEKDIWVSDENWIYVRNSSRLEMLYWIRVDADTIRTRHLGRLTVFSWPSMRLPDATLNQLKEGIFNVLRHQSPLSLSSYRLAIQEFSTISRELSVDLSLGLEHVSIGDFIKVFTAMTPSNAARFRDLHGLMLDLEVEGADSRRHDTLMEFRLRTKGPMTDVLNWNPTTGALTTAELEVLKGHLRPPTEAESSIDHYCRLALRILVTFGRRPVQVSCVTDSGILHSKDERIPSRIEFPGAKFQRNSPRRLYDLPDDLLNDLRAFSARDDITIAQKESGFLLLTPTINYGPRKQPVSAARFNTQLQAWVKRRGIISPRTGNPINITATRIRHTVATQLIMKGWSAEDVSEFLEHLSGQSVLSYIDAVGSELSPELTSVTGHLASIFEKISGSFKGKVIDRPQGKIQKPIVIPDAKNKSIVGQCGMMERCPKNPFDACLNGCPHFLFFRDADTASIRNWINDESRRWADSEDVGKRSRVNFEFAKIDRALEEADSAK